MMIRIEITWATIIVRIQITWAGVEDGNAWGLGWGLQQMQRPGVVLFNNKSKSCRNESKKIVQSPKYGVLVQLLDAVQSPIQRKRKMQKIDILSWIYAKICAFVYLKGVRVSKLNKNLIWLSRYDRYYRVITILSFTSHEGS